MPSANKVTLQINLAPGDYPLARHSLPHQLNALASQVDEILLVVDTRRGKGRFAEGWQQYADHLNLFLSDLAQNYPVTIVPVDYSPAAKKQVANYFFEGNNIPDKDFRGGPFYVYFFGLHAARNNVILHLDADILLGGHNNTWIAEATETLLNTPSCFTVSPLPGPPHPDDVLVGQTQQSKPAAYTYVFNTMSTRIFMMDKSRFSTHKLTFQSPSLRNQLKAKLEGNPPADLPEHIVSAYMQRHQLKRIDFLGTGKGLWSLHPPYRSEKFYNDLPEIIRKVEQNDLPQAQLGFYDIVDEVCDWTEAREKLRYNRWYKRLFRI
ncbi:hypothetical protein C8P68_101503 [Mucilaginibacter yixingensis]|uniref:Glycosyl transferase family 2 n=1 Tax=Mucilaginibacter yixingensis TaxID=1295612 RepID=A0A2T5JFT0_9SPHI|nr:hypothetical protein [Mucilaginibacter yixingensis]PTR01269.1 hypothetical protein C8P68_101503 [Mucilaginibacter yixingensis]